MSEINNYREMIKGLTINMCQKEVLLNFDLAIAQAKQDVFYKVDMEIGFLKRRYEKIPLKLEIFFVDYEKLKELQSEVQDD